jgi:hypothetical protein
MHSIDAKGSTQTNQKNKLGFKSKEQTGNQSVPWSGAPDSLVCHRTMSGAPPDNVRCTRVNQLKLFTFGFLRRTSAIIHRTVRCSTGQVSGGAPGCPVRQRSNGYLRATVDSDRNSAER